MKYFIDWTVNDIDLLVIMVSGSFVSVYSNSIELNKECKQIEKSNESHTPSKMIVCAATNTDSNEWHYVVVGTNDLALASRRQFVGF